MKVSLGGFGQLTAQPVAQPDTSPVRAAQDRLGQTLSATGDMFTRLKQNERAQQVAQLSADSETQLAKVAQDLQTDSDFGTHVERYGQAVKELDENVTRSVKDEAVVKLWRQDFQRQALRRELDVRKTAITGMVGVQKAQLGGTLTTNLSLAGEDPENDSMLREKGRLAIDAAYTHGVLSPKEAMDMSQSYTSGIVSARVRRDISTDPDGTVHRLLTGDYADLSGDDRAKWIDKANASAESVQRQRIADDDRGYKLSERAERERYEITAKRGLSLAASGNVTPTWVEANRDNLSKDDFKYFYRVATGVEEGPRDPMVYADLRDRAGRGDDVRAEAKTALQKNQIGRGDFDRLTGEVESQYPGWKKQGDTYLSTVSGYSEINPTPAAAQTKAAMLDQWTEWANEHPKATNEEARKSWTNIADSYAIAGKAEKIFTLPFPDYMHGTRSQPDLDTSERETVKALQDGRITGQEAAKRADIFRRWREVFTETTTKTDKPQ